MHCPCTVVEYYTGKKKPRKVTRHLSPLRYKRWQNRGREVDVTERPCDGKLLLWWDHTVHCSLDPRRDFLNRDWVLDLADPAEAKACFEHFGIDELGDAVEDFYPISEIVRNLLNHVDWADLVYEFVRHSLPNDEHLEQALVKKKADDRKAFYDMIGGAPKRLFDKCNPVKLRAVYSDLISLRSRHPGYRDDELMLFMLSEDK